MRPCSYSSAWDIKEESLSSDSTLISWVCERARSPKQKRWFQREIAWLETTDQRRTFTRNEMRARSVTNTHTCSQTSRHKHWIVRGLGTAGLHSCTLTQAPQTCGYHKGPCHMLSRYIPTQWCQFVHLNLRLLIYSSETLQLKDKVNSVQSFFFSWSINSDFTPTARTHLFSGSSDEMCESAATANTAGWFQSILAWFI